jgi:hypothetical protein
MDKTVDLLVSEYLSFSGLNRTLECLVQEGKENGRAIELVSNQMNPIAIQEAKVRGNYPISLATVRTEMIHLHTLGHSTAFSLILCNLCSQNFCTTLRMETLEHSLICGRNI